MTECKMNVTDADSMSEEAMKTCDQRCVPEPYMTPETKEDIGLSDYQPIAIEWYAIIHFWDILWVIVSVYIQIRLRSLEKVFGALQYFFRKCLMT